MKPLSEQVAVDTDTFVGAHGKKPKGNGSWIFFADKYKTDIRKDDYYQTPHAMNYGDAVKLTKKMGRREEIISELCGIINTNEEFSF